MIKRRAEFPDLLRKMGLLGKWVELGVAKGNFSQILLQGESSKVYSIDRWAGDRGHDTQQFNEAKAKLARFGDRSVILQKTFSEAAPLFKKESLDFVYVDGYAHTGQDAGLTLEEWWPKVRQGGVFGGHDYHPKWQKTVDAVDDFTAGMDLFTTIFDKFNSWFVFK